jgi:DNA helicase-2/ATP-dependent DNA helicase PcrA
VASDVVSRNEGRLGKTLIAERGKGRNPCLCSSPTRTRKPPSAPSSCSTPKKRAAPSPIGRSSIDQRAVLGFETEFLHRKIPYKVVGSLKFYEREEIKDALAVLALVANGRDEIAFRRIVNKPARGLGEVTQERIIEEARRVLFDAAGALSPAEFSFDDRNDLLSASRRVLDSLPKKARSSLAEFLTTIERLRAMVEGEPGDASASSATRDGAPASLNDPRGASASSATRDGAPASLNDEPSSGPADVPAAGGKKRKRTRAKTLADFVDTLIESSGLLAYHQGQDEIAGTQRVANLQELVNAASLYPLSREGLIEFLEHIELDRSMAEETDDADSVTLITVHNTKGLEFRRVVVTGLESGVFPREDKKGDDLEEERRLMYVACTRAMDELYLTSCAARRLYGRTAFMEPSPFLHEIDLARIEVLGRAPGRFSRGLRGQLPRARG